MREDEKDSLAITPSSDLEALLRDRFGVGPSFQGFDPEPAAHDRLVERVDMYMIALIPIYGDQVKNDYTGVMQQKAIQLMKVADRIVKEMEEKK